MRSGLRAGTSFETDRPVLCQMPLWWQPRPVALSSLHDSGAGQLETQHRPGSM